MADYQIDELSLKIDIEGASKKNADNIRDIASAIRSLNKAVSNSGALNNLKAYSKNLQKLAGSIRSSFADIKSGTAAGGVTPKMVEVGGGNKNKKQPPKAQTGTSNRKNLAQNQKDLNKALNETEKAGHKAASGWSKFTKSIGRIAMYRAIRRALQIIVKSATDGLENIRSVNSELDKSMRNMSLAGTSLKNSFASLLAPLIESVTPLVTRISDGIATIVNRITEAKAALNGASTYTKILTSDTKEWQEQLKKVKGYLLSFDKFESLNKEQSYTGVAETQVGMSVEEAESITNKLENIKIIVNAIGAGFLTWKISTLLTDVSKLSGILGSAKSLTGIAGVLVGIYGIIQSIRDFIDWGDTMTNLQKFLNILRILFGITAAIAGAIAFIRGGLVGGVAAGIAALSTIGVLLTTMKLNAEKSAAQGYANGGIPETGTLFYAGEAGAEIVSTSRTGQTGVANVEQISQAMLQALINYNAAQNGQSSGGNVYLDGRQVGQLVESSVYREGVRVGHFKRA